MNYIDQIINYRGDSCKLFEQHSIFTPYQCSILVSNLIFTAYIGAIIIPIIALQTLDN